MRVCVVSLNRFVHDSPARVLARSLVHVGHDVIVVAGGPGPDTHVDGAEVRFVPTRYPHRRGRAARLLRRLQPPVLRKLIFRRALAAAARATRAEIFHPSTPAAVPVAARAASGGTAFVARRPDWPPAGERDLIRVAPGSPRASVSPAGPGLPLFTPGGTEQERMPSPGRFAGARIALCYRKTDTNPGRYIEAALRRAGVTVDLYTDRVPWTRMASSVDGVVFVESPYPALEVEGRNPGFPVLFWVHHGEHRLMANIRLCERYGAHAVLLAHSWHLAHRFPVPVHRFPFAVAPELFAERGPGLAERRYDVAFVGAGLESDNRAYARRRELLAKLEAALGQERVAFRQGVSAARMAATYEQARLVVDEGGTKHLPITMRVFEALGAGCVVLTDEAPGVELLLERDRHYVAMAGDPVRQARELLGDPLRLREIATAGYEHARRHHTYDHRIDDLMAILDSVRGEAPRPEPQQPGGIAGLVHEDVEVQSVLAFGAGGLDAALPLRDVRDGGEMIGRLRAGAADAVVIGAEGTAHLVEAVLAARRFVYAETQRDEVTRIITDRLPGARFSRGDGLMRVELPEQ